jgi:hypothetical protein
MFICTAGDNSEPAQDTSGDCDLRSATALFIDEDRGHRRDATR